MWRIAISDSTKGSRVQAIASTSSSTASLPPGSSNGLSPSAGRISPVSGASRASTQAPLAISSAVTDSGSACSSRRLLSEAKIATSSADTPPTAMPTSMPSGTPSVTSSTPGRAATPSATSRLEMRLPVNIGSISAVITVTIAMQITPTEAFDSFTAA